jgi:uncharacterized protein YeaO (DUF488 family)
MIKLKRIHEPAAVADGYRALVDRQWPLGVNKEDARLTEWLRDIAPSDELRQWFGQAPERFAEFGERYRGELGDPSRAGHLDRLRRLAKQGTVTLLFGARDAKHNGAVVLHDVLTGKGAVAAK